MGQFGEDTISPVTTQPNPDGATIVLNNPNPKTDEIATTIFNDMDSEPAIVISPEQLSTLQKAQEPRIPILDNYSLKKWIKNRETEPRILNDELTIKTIEATTPAIILDEDYINYIGICIADIETPDEKPLTIAVLIPRSYIAKIIENPEEELLLVEKILILKKLFPQEMSNGTNLYRLQPTSNQLLIGLKDTDPNLSSILVAVCIGSAKPKDIFKRAIIIDVDELL